MTDPTDEMVEAMAKVLWEQSGIVPWEDAHEDVWRSSPGKSVMRHIARAALAVLRAAEARGYAAAREQAAEVGREAASGVYSTPDRVAAAIRAMEPEGGAD